MTREFADDVYNPQFSYDRSWASIEDMLEKAERKQNKHYVAMQKCKRSERMYHMRNYKALEGVVKSLRWVLGDRDIEHPLE